MPEIVAENYLLPPHENCPVCLSKSFNDSDFVLQSSPEIRMKHCSNCGADSAHRFPTAEYLNGLYDPANYTPSLASDDRLSQRAAVRLLRRLKGNLNSGSLKIVDFGGSDGNFARLLKSALLSESSIESIEITVVDLFERPMEDGIRFLSNEQFIDDPASYDIVLASAVLEHLPNMQEVLKLLLSKASKGAVFYARTPYDLPIARLGLKSRVVWPRHLYDLGPDFWDNFFETFGVKGSFIYSGPSIIQTNLYKRPLETILALLLKLPGYFEILFLRKFMGIKKRLWPLVGGWEITLRLN